MTSPLAGATSGATRRMEYYEHKLIKRAQKLRKNMTEEERKLWYSFLRSLPVKFVRQKAIGNYIVDFYCASKKLVIELDGSQHYEDEGKEYDKVRDAYLQSLGLTVLRYSNYDFHKMYKAICEDIWNHLGID